MNLDIPIHHWTDIFKLLDDPSNLHTINQNIRVNIIALTIHILYVSQNEFDDLFRHHKLQDYQINLWHQSVVCKFEHRLSLMILMLPTIKHELHLRQKYTDPNTGKSLQVFNQRTRAMIGETHWDVTKLSDELLNLFQQTWCLTNLAKIDNKSLKIAPFRRDPP